jgi:hypothetical protein
MSGRPHALTYPKIRVIDEWWRQGVRNKTPSRKVLAARLGISLQTLTSAAKRRYAYAKVPQELDRPRP